MFLAKSADMRWWGGDFLVSTSSCVFPKTFFDESFISIAICSYLSFNKFNWTDIVEIES